MSKKYIRLGDCHGWCKPLEDDLEFKGKISNINIYDKALSDEEFKKIYYNNNNKTKCK